MKTIRFFLLLTGLCLFYLPVAAQNRVSYVYDSAGNRTGRTIILSAPALSSEHTEETTAYTEVLADLRIRIYPNPTRGLLRIDIENLPAGETADIRVFNLSGSAVAENRKVTASTEMNISGQPDGIYILKIVAGKEQSEWKIIKK